MGVNFVDWLLHNFLPFIVLITVLVFVHEWGHFWVARRSGVRVTQFAIGFGPELFGWTDRQHTRWRFCLIPLGGYIKMLGDGDVSSTTQVEVDASEKHLTLDSKPPLQRIAVAAAGPLANFLFAWVVLVGLMYLKGAPVLEPVLGGVQEGSVAAKHDLRAGDRLTHIGDQEIKTFQDMRNAMSQYIGKDMPLTLQRDGKTETKTVQLYTINPTTHEQTPQKKLGVMSPQPTYIKHSFFSSIPLALTTIGDLCMDMLRGIGMMISGGRSAEMGGLLTIGDMAAQSVQNGLTSISWFLVVLSVNLGLLNLFPIPVLDGGHILLNTLELIRKKPLNEKAQGIIFKMGFVLLVSIMVYANWSDLTRYGVTKFVSQLWKP